ncbi:MAG: TatD family deoxyribonuclease [Proteobacteria bacterium]|nr:MAG: TatD family deoxyribonuclease [Pseudomonadota bacterium]
MQLVDSHCHLPLVATPARSVPEIVANAVQNGVSHMLCVCVQLETFAEVHQAAFDFDNVYASVGVHPNTDEEASEPSTNELIELGNDPVIVAIGETGLDYFRGDGDLQWQRDRFRRHIRAARELGKPLIIHNREAAADVVEILREEQASDVGGVMHCFVDDWDTASAAMDLGFYISISGIVTFKSAGALRIVAAQVPLERLLLETDSPWLAPVPRRGKQNEPAYVRYTAEFLADLRGITLDDIAQATTGNFFELFKPAH